MNICESLTVTSRLFPDRTAIVFGDQSSTYDSLNRKSIEAARFLSEQGVGPGDRVALMIPNAPAFPIWYYAVLRIGAIAVAINTRLAPGEVEFVTSDCDAKAFIANADTLDSVAQSLSTNLQLQLAVDDLTGQPVESQDWRREPIDSENLWYQADPDEPALILYTSGTTGFPKGATLTHGNVRSNVHAFNHLCNMRLEDRVLLAVPLFHCFGQNAILNSVLNVGGTIVLQQRFDLNESKRLIAKHQITQLYGVPMMFGLLLESCTRADLASVNYCFSAAATLPVQTSLAWQEKFRLPIYEGYGLTETSPFATYNHRNKFVPGSIGMAIDSVEIKIADTESGETCLPGELGEIAIRGPNVMLGYWNRPQETAAAIRNGWFHSGDIGRMDEQGYLYIVDRVKDMITVGGLKVFPAEVERVLMDHPAVHEAAVIGVPDSVFGEQVIAYLVLDDEGEPAKTLADVRQHAQSHLGKYKIPRRLLVIDQLPRNPSGKILKTTLREMTANAIPVPNHNQGPEQVATADHLKPASLRKLLATAHESEKLRIATRFLRDQVRKIGELDAEPSAEDSFVEAGLDSLAIVTLGAQMQVEVGPQLDLPPTLLFDHPRLCDLAEFLVNTLDGALPEPTAVQTPTVNAPINTSAPKRNSTLQSEVEQMTEAEALAELMKELE